MTAAHPTLPFFSKVTITNLENGKSAEVIINDRGPFDRSRIIDVSEAAATKLDFKRQGMAKVEVKINQEKEVGE